MRKIYSKLIASAFAAAFMLTPAQVSAQSIIPSDIWSMIMKWIGDENITLEEASAKIEEAQMLLNYHTEGRDTIEPVKNLRYETRQAWRAPIDGIYYGIGHARNMYKQAGIDPWEVEMYRQMYEGYEQMMGNIGFTAVVRGKRSGSYAWSMQAQNNKLYWGMCHNFLCHATNTSADNSQNASGSVLDGGSYETSCWVCEGEKDARAKGDIMAADMIPPRVYCYDPMTGYVEDIAPIDDELTKYTQGFRCCGGINGVMFFAGPDEKYGSSIYAYDTATDKLIASGHFENAIVGEPDMKVTNMRKCITLDGVLYLGIAYEKDGKQGGAILRWYGDKKDPMQFKVVALCDQCVGEMTIHNNHLFVGGWAVNNGDTDKSIGIYRSKTEYDPTTGLTPDNVMEFDNVWRYSMYDPNPVTSAVAWCAEVRSYKGQLYWGVLSGAWTTPIIANGPLYQQQNTLEKINAMLGSIRPTTLWRGDFKDDEDKAVEMLYGDSTLTVFDYAEHKWKIAPNASGYKAKFGRSGFGNLFNNYGAWAMREYKGDLYIGTMDCSNLVKPFVSSNAVATLGNGKLILSALIDPLLEEQLAKDPEGFDLFRISDPEEPAECITNNGFGNPAAYGIRNMEYLYEDLVIGTANPLNISDNGGAEVILFNTDRLTAIPEVVAIDNVESEKKPMAVSLRQEENFLRLNSVDETKKIEKAELYDVSGKLVKIGELNCGETLVYTFDLPAGVYVVKTTIDGKAYSKKITVE